MKTMKLKLTNDETGRLTMQHPEAIIGLSPDGRIYTYEITEIPDETPASEVVRLANGSVFFAAKYDGSGRYTYNFSELGMGRIIR